MTKGIIGFLKTPTGEYVFNFLYMALFMTIALGLYDLYLDKPFKLLSFLLRFIIFGLLGLIIMGIEKSAGAKRVKKEQDNPNQ